MVLAPGALVVTSLPSAASLQRGQTSNVTAVVRNSSGVAANNVLPSPIAPTVAVTGTAAATLTSAAPAAQILAAGASAPFTFPFRESVAGAGELRFTVGASGTDSGTNAAVSANPTQSN